MSVNNDPASSSTVATTTSIAVTATGASASTKTVDALASSIATITLGDAKEKAAAEAKRKMALKIDEVDDTTLTRISSRIIEKIFIPGMLTFRCRVDLMPSYRKHMREDWETVRKLGRTHVEMAQHLANVANLAFISAHQSRIGMLAEAVKGGVEGRQEYLTLIAESLAGIPTLQQQLSAKEAELPYMVFHTPDTESVMKMGAPNAVNLMNRMANAFMQIHQNSTKALLHVMPTRDVARLPDENAEAESKEAENYRALDFKIRNLRTNASIRVAALMIANIRNYGFYGTTGQPVFPGQTVTFLPTSRQGEHNYRIAPMDIINTLGLV